MSASAFPGLVGSKSLCILALHNPKTPIRTSCSRERSILIAAGGLRIPPSQLRVNDPRLLVVCGWGRWESISPCGVDSEEEFEDALPVNQMHPLGYPSVIQFNHVSARHLQRYVIRNESVNNLIDHKHRIISSLSCEEN